MLVRSALVICRRGFTGSACNACLRCQELVWQTRMCELLLMVSVRIVIYQFLLQRTITHSFGTTCTQELLR